MLGKTHGLAGLCTGVALASTTIPFNYSSNTIILIGCLTMGSVIGSYFPDIDKRNTTISNKNTITKISASILNTLFGHRGLIHTPFFYLVLYFILSFIFLKGNISSIYQILISLSLKGFLFGTFSHLFLDMFNKEGIPLLFPFTLKKMKIPFITIREGIADKIFQIILFILLIGLITNYIV